MALASVITVLGSTAELLPAWFTRRAINYLARWAKLADGASLLSFAQDVPPVIWPFALLILLVAVIRNLLRFANTMSGAELSTRITNTMRERMYEAVQRHSLTYHKKTTTGDLISRSTRDVMSIHKFVSSAVFMAVDMVVFLICATVALVWINPVFALIALSPVPLAVYLTFHFGARVRTLWKKSSEKYGEVTTVVQENIAGARVVRAFAQEDAEESKFAEHADSYLAHVIDAIRFWVIRMITSHMIFSLVTPIAVVYGSYAVIRGSIEVGDVAFCFFCMGPLMHRMRFVMRLVETYQSAAAGAERVFEVLDEEPSIQSAPGAEPISASPAGTGALVEFKNISFGYEPDKPAVNDITFAAKPGQTIAIVGRTGSGKSTLISLIPRFHDPTSGSITINGTDVRNIELRQLRRSIGIIFQETFLFSASVRENIAYGRPGANDELIRAAAGAARAHDFIMALDDGYDAIIGERGVTLSGGQAQRIAIARAVLLDPKVLIMDDATASVDSETERLIRETMRQVAKGRTNFIVAHRISSVAHADHILVLDGGRIIEQGTHAELIALNGAYRRIRDQQLLGSVNGT